MAIPKIIHQTYASANFPAEIAANIERLQAMNPGWQYAFYDDAAIEVFIRRYYDLDMLALYQRINPVYGAARADFFRYLLVYQFGGVYLDIKSTALQPLDTLIAPQDRYVLAYWPNAQGEPFEGWGLYEAPPEFPRGEFQNWHIMAEPHHPFLRGVIAQVITNIRAYSVDVYGVGQLGVLRTTGPFAYTHGIRPYLNSCPHRLAGSHVDLGLAYSMLQGDSHKQLFKAHYTALSEPVVLP